METHSRRGRRALSARQFSHDADGNSLVEYALLMAMVVGVAMFGIEMLGYSSRGTFERLTGRAGSAGAPRSGGATGAAALDTGEAADAGAVTAAPPSIAPGLAARLATQFAALVACSVLWYVTRQRRMRPVAPADQPANQPPVFDVQNARLFGKRQQILGILSNDLQALFDGRMLVRHLMSTQLTTVPPKLRTTQIRELMLEGKLRHVLVVEDEKLLGVISDRDLARDGGNAARQLMTPNPITVPSSSLVSPAVTLMMRKQISCLPVVDDGKLVGLFTTTDLMMALQCAFQALQSFSSEEQEASEEVSPDGQPSNGLPFNRRAVTASGSSASVGASQSAKEPEAAAV